MTKRTKGASLNCMWCTRMPGEKHKMGCPEYEAPVNPVKVEQVYVPGDKVITPDDWTAVVIGVSDVGVQVQVDNPGRNVRIYEDPSVLKRWYQPPTQKDWVRSPLGQVPLEKRAEVEHRFHAGECAAQWPSVAGGWRHRCGLDAAHDGEHICQVWRCQERWPNVTVAPIPDVDVKVRTIWGVITTERLAELFVDSASEVADEFYPKGSQRTYGTQVSHPHRGEFLRDQAVLLVKLLEKMKEPL